MGHFLPFSACFSRYKKTADTRVFVFSYIYYFYSHIFLRDENYIQRAVNAQ